ncbi:MAG: hypothetical protein RLZZ230_300 [Candidatus Parcubacteria bacterium]|jgi:hypothetical protein
MNTLQKIGAGLLVVSLAMMGNILYGNKIKFLIAILIPVIVLIGIVKLLKFMRDIKNGKFEDLRLDLGVSDVNVYCRYGISLVAGLIATSLIWSLDVLLGSYLLDDTFIIFAIFICLTFFFAQAETADTVVPAGKVAIMTFWGFRFRVFLNEGVYPWTGKSLGIHRSAEVRTEGTTSDGFVNIKDFPMSIWNQSSERNKLKLECLASDNASEVFTTLTLLVRIIDPIKWINSTDPALDLADKAREALRSIIAFFTAIDNTKMKGVYWEMMRGKTIITVFTPKSTNEYMKGTVIRSAGGAPMYEVVDGDIEVAKAVFETKVRADSDQEMLQKCLVNGQLKIETRSVATIFLDVMDRVGVTVDSATIGNIDLSKVVTDAANKAASEPAQREGQMASANTIADSTAIIRKAREAGASELELGITAAADNKNVKVVITGGSSNNRLRDAAATHAALTGNNGENNE